MIETPSITTTKAQHTAVIHLRIPQTEMRQAMGPGLKELMGTIAAQGLMPAGPWFTHHLKFSPGTFDFEISVPVEKPVSPAGRVEPRMLPAMRVARTVHTGGYEGLHSAWEEFNGWLKSTGHAPREDLLEIYVKGPESSQDPAAWRTELIRPLAD